jgi:cell division protein FtsB
MNVDLSIWDKLSRVVIFLLFLGGLLGVVVCYLPLVRQNEAIRRETLRLDTQIRFEEERGRQLEARIRAIRNDPKTVERLAREKLGYIRPGETRIQFDSPMTNVFARP